MTLTMQEMFVEGGWGMYPVMYFGAFGISFALIHAMAPSVRMGMVAAGALGLSLAAGFGAEAHGLRRMEDAIKNVAPEMGAEILAQGSMEAHRPVELGLGVVGLGILPLLIGFLRKTKPGQSPTDPGGAPVPVAPPAHAYAPPRTDVETAQPRQRTAIYSSIGFLFYCLAVWVQVSSALGSGLVVATRGALGLDVMVPTFLVGTLFTYLGVRLRRN